MVYCSCLKIIVMNGKACTTVINMYADVNYEITGWMKYIINEVLVTKAHKKTEQAMLS